MRYRIDKERLLIIQIANLGSIGLNSVLQHLSYRRWSLPALDGAQGSAPTSTGGAGTEPSGTREPA